MKALSVRQPWAGLIAAGVKDIENRGQQTHHRGLVAVHASLRYDNAAYEQVKVRRGHGAIAVERRQLLYHLGVIIAVAEPVGCHQAGATTVKCCAPWGEEFHGTRPAWHWRFADVRPVTPVPARGQLGLWTVPDDIAALIDDTRVKELTA